MNENEDAVKKLIQSSDFSKINPAHKIKLRQALFTRRKLSDEELGNIAAAGTAALPEETENKFKK